MNRARLNRYADWISTVCCALTLVAIVAGMVLSVLDGNRVALLWQACAFLGHVLALLTLYRIRLYTEGTR